MIVKIADGEAVTITTHAENISRHLSWVAARSRGGSWDRYDGGSCFRERGAGEGTRKEEMMGGPPHPTPLPLIGLPPFETPATPVDLNPPIFQHPLVHLLHLHIPVPPPFPFVLLFFLPTLSSSSQLFRSFFLSLFRLAISCANALKLLDPIGIIRNFYPFLHPLSLSLCCFFVLPQTTWINNVWQISTGTKNTLVIFDLTGLWNAGSNKIIKNSGLSKVE